MVWSSGCRPARASTTRRTSAAWVIGQWRKEDTLGYIIQHGIGHKKWQVVYFCVDGLGRTKSRAALPTLVDKLKHNTWQVRFAAAIGIAQFKTSAVKTAGPTVDVVLRAEKVDKVTVALIDAMAAMNHAGETMAPAVGDIRKYHDARHAVFLRMYDDFMAYRRMMA